MTSERVHLSVVNKGSGGQISERQRDFLFVTRLREMTVMSMNGSDS